MIYHRRRERGTLSLWHIKIKEVGRAETRWINGPG